MSWASFVSRNRRGKEWSYTPFPLLPEYSAASADGESFLETKTKLFTLDIEESDALIL